MRKINRKKCLYIARVNEDKDLGVVRKIEDFNQSLRRKGFEVENYFISPSLSILDTIRNLYAIHKFRGKDVLILRSFYILDIFLIPIFFLTPRKVSIVIDFPVPRSIALKEAKVFRQGFSLIRWKLLHFISGPWCYWWANKLIQYSRESNYFSLGNEKKTYLTGNGISSNRFGLRDKMISWPQSIMNLVFVGYLQNHHGVDRLLKACHKFNYLERNSFKINLTIVGDGPLLSELEILTKDLGIEDYVTFTGSLKGEDLLRTYNYAHAAVSSLGLHRLGLIEASVLKAREYCLVGIPFIASGLDVDFNSSLPFRIEVTSDEDLNSLCDAFRCLDSTLCSIDDLEINRYALNNLTFDSKLDKIGKPFI